MKTIYVLIIFWLLVLLVLLGALVIGTILILDEWFGFHPGRQIPPPGPVSAEVADDELDTPPAPILYRLSRQWAANVGRPVGVAVDPKQRIYVAGQTGVQVFDHTGTVLGQWELKESVRCIAAAPADHCRPGAIYLGYSGRVEMRTDKGEPFGGWALPTPQAEPTSIALSQKEIFVADFAAKCVYRFDADGRLLGQIGKSDPARGYTGLIMPSPYCDVAVDSEGLVWVANPGLRRLEAYRSGDGRLERFWGGQNLQGPAGFFGCCNPAHFCILPDGRFVTAEKGRLRLKVYGPDGDWEGWVISPSEWQKLAESNRVDNEAAKPEHWTERIVAADLAADSQGRIVVLYLANSKVYLFDPVSPP